jgi:hypothetical protein
MGLGRIGCTMKRCGRIERAISDKGFEISVVKQLLSAGTLNFSVIERKKNYFLMAGTSNLK